MKQRLVSVIILSLILGLSLPGHAHAFSLTNPTPFQVSPEKSLEIVPEILRGIPSQTVDAIDSPLYQATGSASIDTSFLIEEVKVAPTTESAAKSSALPISPDNVKGVSTYFNSFHPAIDIRAEIGSPIVAIRDGVVLESEYQAGGYGRYIVIEHTIGDRAVRSLYAHLQSANVRVGDKVTAKDLIGHVGMTGHTTGPHLHMEVRVCQREDAFYLCPAIDPIRFLTKGLPGTLVAKK